MNPLPCGCLAKKVDRRPYLDDEVPDAASLLEVVHCDFHAAARLPQSGSWTTGDHGKDADLRACAPFVLAALEAMVRKCETNQPISDKLLAEAKDIIAAATQERG